jgi:hypothetical protein
VTDGRVDAVTVDMGKASLFAEELPLPAGLGTGMGVSVGNPHAVSFVELAEGIPCLCGDRLWRKAYPVGLTPNSSRSFPLFGCVCGCGNGAAASRWPAAPAPAQPPLLR